MDSTQKQIRKRRTTCRALFLLFLGLSVTRIQETNSSFSDKAMVGGNIFSMSKVPIHNESGKVVINEVMWMGSFEQEKDEWIELRNMTDRDINIKNWNIEGATNGNGHLEIAGDDEKKNKSDDKDKYIIPKQGYFLITRLSEKKTSVKAQPDLVKKSLSLDDSYKKNGQLVLRDQSGAIIDRTPTPNHLLWPSGWHGFFLHLSMEKNNDAIFGMQEDNWHTCAISSGFGKKYWKTGSYNCGTPGKENLEKSDRVLRDCEKGYEEELAQPEKKKENVL